MVIERSHPTNGVVRPQAIVPHSLCLPYNSFSGPNAPITKVSKSPEVLEAIKLLRQNSAATVQKKEGEDKVKSFKSVIAATRGTVDVTMQLKIGVIIKKSLCFLSVSAQNVHTGNEKNVTNGCKDIRNPICDVENCRYDFKKIGRNDIEHSETKKKK